MDTFRNRLLAALPEASVRALSERWELVDLPLRETLCTPDMQTQAVYFLEAGLASAVAHSPTEDERIEVGHIGYEGMTGLNVILDADQTPIHTFMQVAGKGFRVPVDRFRTILDEDAKFRSLLLRYVQTYQLQIAYSALANGRYTIPERLARWLLMCHDRLGSDEMPLTHDFLALMLGVRRSGVTNEIHVLEGNHAIRATRGSIYIRNRTALLELAGGSYGVPEREYARLIEARS